MKVLNRKEKSYSRQSITSWSFPFRWESLVRYMMNSSVALVMRKRLSWPMFSTSGLLFMMVRTLLRGSRTSLDLRGEAEAVGVLETALRLAGTGVAGELSVIVVRSEINEMSLGLRTPLNESLLMTTLLVATSELEPF